MIRIIYHIVLVFLVTSTYACQCPILNWTKEIVNQNDVIIRGIIKNIYPHQNDYSVVEFEVMNVFKGNPHKMYKVLFPENDECAITINVGEEWLIYGKSKQINSCEIEWCGFSRKKFPNDAEDFFIATHLITYSEELEKLKTYFPEIKITTEPISYQSHKNIIPNKSEMYIYMALSLIGFLIFIVIVKKYLK